jgi:hypothetical protein
MPHLTMSGEIATIPSIYYHIAVDLLKHIEVLQHSISIYTSLITLL